MLYLAEVQKQKGGLLSGGGKSELKLIACQRTDQNWSPIPDEMIVADEASKFNDGALVLVDLSPNRQVQRVQDAGRPLVNILQNFSRQVERFKLKEEEIDQWKQSLNLQIQELNRREMEMESRWDEVQKLENDSKRIDTQQHLVNTSRTEVERLRAEVERNRRDLEGAWEHLRVEQRCLEEIRLNVQQSQSVDNERGQKLSDLLNRLSSTSAPINIVKESLGYAFEFANKQQDALNLHWQKLDIQRHGANQQQREGEELVQSLGDRQNELQQAQDSLAQKITQLQSQITIVNSKQELTAILKQHLETEEEFYHKLHLLATKTSAEVAKPAVDVTALQQMPLKELEKMVQDWQEKLDRDSNFVQEQEQELKYKQELIEELQQKIVYATGEELVNLDLELADEQDLYQMLNESLVGQRRNLIGQQKTLQQNQVVLWQRQGISVEIKGEPSDLELLVSQLAAEKQRKSAEIEKLESDIALMLITIAADQVAIDHQTQEVEIKRREVDALEKQLLNLRTATAECWGRVNIYQEALQPIQDELDRLREQLTKMGESLTQVQAFGDSQLQVVFDLRQVIESFINLPEVLVS
ncbi:pilus motility taxis protein HmpF [Aphanizomenon sp. CS-733/32]|uniref:pilus motility taxis protein HmpF n=1 Tax=Aphanizomenon sp. CS-733/32 TaxID=3021715 RepID=UPI00232AF6F8|nr:pilus motility taxis protein HmpF [Aphanizomenon sp. CS-733/32]MDB9311441.1 pilus motility taxis protein HmpF [Aphanizomenon sp. CS-733/32]